LTSLKKEKNIVVQAHEAGLWASPVIVPYGWKQAGNALSLFSTLVDPTF